MTMRPAQTAKQRLKGNWKQAVAVQILLLLAGGALSAAEFGALFFLGLGLDQSASAAGVLSGRESWWRLAILLGAVLADLFLLSPLYAGQALFYKKLAFPAPPAPPPMVEREENGVVRLEPDRSEPLPKKVPVAVLGRFYRGKAYGKAVRWRLLLWIYRSLWSLLWYAPAALALGYGEYVRRTMESSALRDVTLVFTSFLGLFGLIAGFLAVQLIMLRWMPAQYLLEEAPTVRSAFKRARRMMKGQVGNMAWLYMGFSGWLFACLAVIPYFYAAPLFLTTRAGAVYRLTQKEDVPAPKPAKIKPPEKRRSSQRRAPTA
jgi:uncharacterized membrane protein